MIIAAAGLELEVLVWPVGVGSAWQYIVQGVMDSFWHGDVWQ